MNTLSILEQAARAAGAVALSYFQKEAHISRKTSHQNLVTVADTTCQALIQKIVMEELGKCGVQENEIGFIGEEKLDTQGTTHSFIIDPIDGTNNFASGLDYFCVSIAHAEHNVVKDSVIYWPKRDALYYAAAGEGAFKKSAGQSPIRLSIQDELLENCVLFSTLSSDSTIRKESYAVFEKIIPAVRALRLNGSVCLDLVHVCERENAAHIVLNFRVYLWDMAAAYLIVRESGGIFADHQGKEITVDYTDSKRIYSFIAAHPNVVKEVAAYLG